MNERARRLNLALHECERAQKKTTLESLPLEIQLEATNRCRQRCQSCARNFYDPEKNPPGEMNKDILEAVSPLFPFAEKVLVGGYGEPLLAEITFDILRRARREGCHTSVITCGDNLRSKSIGKLAKVELSELILSIDGASNETNLARRGVALSDILPNLRRLREKLPRLRTAFNITLHVDNLAELPAFVELAVHEQIDAINVFHQKIYSAGQVEKSVFQDTGQAAKFYDQANDLARRHNVSLELPPLQGSWPCEQPYRLIAVRHDGLAQGCCSTLFEADLPRVLLGHLPEDDPFELWNAPAIIAARHWTLGNGPTGFACQHCAFRVFSLKTHQRFLDQEKKGR